MLHEFLEANRLELAQRCERKVAARRSPPPTSNGHAGVPVLIDQLTSMLREAQVDEGFREPMLLSPEIEVSASMHGGDLLRRGLDRKSVV